MTDIDTPGVDEALSTPQADPTDSPFGADAPAMVEDEYGNQTYLGEPSEAPEAPETPETPTVEMVKIGDREFPAEQALELLSKGEDYTKKTMTLAEERKALQEDAAAYQALTKAWADPNARVQIIAELQRQAGITPSQSAGTTQSQPTVGLPDDWDEWYPNEQKLWKEKQALAAEVKQMKDVMTQVRDHLQGSTQKERQSLAARETAAALSTKYQRQIGFEEVLEASLKNDIPNLEAAWIYENRDALTAPVAPGVPPVGKKPNTPSTRGNTFDPSDMDADEIMSRMDKGMIPLQK